MGTTTEGRSLSRLQQQHGNTQQQATAKQGSQVQPSKVVHLTVKAGPMPLLAAAGEKQGEAGGLPDWQLAVPAPAAGASSEQQAGRATGGHHLRLVRDSAPMRSQELMGALLREVHSLAPEDSLLTARSARGPPNLARRSPLSRFQTETAQADRQRQLEGQLQDVQRQLAAQQRDNQLLRQQLQDRRSQLQQLHCTRKMCGCFGF